MAVPDHAGRARVTRHCAAANGSGIAPGQSNPSSSICSPSAFRARASRARRQGTSGANAEQAWITAFLVEPNVTLFVEPHLDLNTSTLAGPESLGPTDQVAPSYPQQPEAPTPRLSTSPAWLDERHGYFRRRNQRASVGTESLKTLGCHHSPPRANPVLSHLLGVPIVRSKPSQGPTQDLQSLRIQSLSPQAPPTPAQVFHDLRVRR